MQHSFWHVKGCGYNKNCVDVPKEFVLFICVNYGPYKVTCCYKTTFFTFIIIYITESVYLRVCLFVSLFLTHGRGFERIWTKFGMWHPNILRTVMGGLASALRARGLALRAPPIRRYKWLASSIGKFGTMGGRHNRPSAAGARERRRCEK